MHSNEFINPLEGLDIETRVPNSEFGKFNYKTPMINDIWI